jgi:hypothetical protein
MDVHLPLQQRRARPRLQPIVAESLDSSADCAKLALKARSGTKLHVSWRVVGFTVVG